jgi:hypothetical protein
MPDRGAVVVKLQRDADDLEALLDQQSRSHRRIDATRHRDDDAVVGGVSSEDWFLEPRACHPNSNCCISDIFRLRNFDCNGCYSILIR